MTRRCPLIVATRSVVDALTQVALLGIAFLQIKVTGRRLRFVAACSLTMTAARTAFLGSRKGMLVPRMSARNWVRNHKQWMTYLVFQRRILGPTFLRRITGRRRLCIVTACCLAKSGGSGRTSRTQLPQKLGLYDGTSYETRCGPPTSKKRHLRPRF